MAFFFYVFRQQRLDMSEYCVQSQLSAFKCKMEGCLSGVQIIQFYHRAELKFRMRDAL